MVVCAVIRRFRRLCEGALFCCSASRSSLLAKVPTFFMLCQMLWYKKGPTYFYGEIVVCAVLRRSRFLASWLAELSSWELPKLRLLAVQTGSTGSCSDGRMLPPAPQQAIAPVPAARYKKGPTYFVIISSRFLQKGGAVVCIVYHVLKAPSVESF